MIFICQKKIEISEKGEINGNSLLLLLENSANEKSNYDIDCSFSLLNPLNNEGQIKDVKINLEKIQETSKKLDGYFKLNIFDVDNVGNVDNDEDKNKKFISENIPVFTNNFEDYFQSIYFLNDKIQLLKNYLNDYSAIYYIRLDLHVNKIK